ncbi:hypothetical protein HY256_08220, partial [Candidatus Sumerlaeota bacterium]|nr:hypothetical protein [Candidatus Sumerlaeota bacterium]
MKLHRRSRLCAALLAAAVMSIPFAPAIAWADGAEKSSNLKGWLGVDLVEMIGTADILGKMALVVLAIMSVATWTVIVFKFIHIRRARVQTDSFVRSCGHGTGQLHEAFKIAADYPDSPLAQILREAYMELEIENWYREGYNLDDAGR